jgi:hypothetical protein
MIVAATPIDPPADGKCWAFHVVNDSAAPIESMVLEDVSYEWGDMGGGSSPNLRFGPLAPGASVEIWRDDDNAAELRMELELLVRDGGGERRVTAEFGKLYRVRQLQPIPGLGRDGVAARELRSSPVAKAPGTIEIDDAGVRRWLADGGCEAVRWDGLTHVELVTTDERPLLDDIFWVLHGSDGGGCVIPSQADDGLLDRLQELPGFDNEAFIQAMGSASPGRIELWKKPQ